MMTWASPDYRVCTSLLMMDSSRTQTRHKPGSSPSGRDSLIADIHTALSSQATGQKVCVLKGPEGIGKTQTAKEYVHRHVTDYEFIGWLQAEEPLTLAVEFAGLAAALDLSEKTATDLRTVIKSVQLWLEQTPKWLLVFDGAQSLGTISQYLPARVSGHTLVTSRNSRWKDAQVLEATTFSQGEAVDLLLRRSKRGHDQAASKLAKALANAPFSLDQAGSYIRETGESFSDYLVNLRRQKSARQAKSYSKNKRLLLKTFALSARKVEQISPA